MIAERHGVPVGAVIGADGEPAGVVEEGVGDDAGGGWVVGLADLPYLDHSVRTRTYVRLMLTPREQGDIGELSAMYWLASRGASVALPVGNSRHWDLIAEVEGRLIRVQVKTSTCCFKDRWDVTLCTRGGNRSWSGEVKRLDPSRYDYLFVLTGGGRRWFIPSGRVAGGSGLRLGGPKYAEFEVERGEPIPGHTAEESASTIVFLKTRGDVRAVKGDRL